MKTIVGIAADRFGLVRGRSWSTASGEVRRVQAERIAVDWCHGPPQLGEVTHAEIDPHGSLWLVAEVDDSVAPVVGVEVSGETVPVAVDLFWSLETDATVSGRDIKILSAALTPSPARLAARPVSILDGDLAYRQAAQRWRGQLPASQLQLLERAAHTRFDRRVNGGPIVVRDAPPTAHERSRMHPHEVAELAEDQAWRGRPLRVRPAVITDVR